jgi:hypothetical protein
VPLGTVHMSESSRNSDTGEVSSVELNAHI